MALPHLLATLILLGALTSASTAMAQKRPANEGGAEGPAVAAAVIGTLAGGTLGAVGGFEIGVRAGGGGLNSLGTAIAGGVLGTIVVGATTGMGAGVATVSVLDPGHRAEVVLGGAGAGALLGTTVLLVTLRPQETPLSPFGLLTLPVLGAGVGALIGFAIPTGSSVALTPLDGGAAAHVGFTF